MRRGWHALQERPIRFHSGEAEKIFGNQYNSVCGAQLRVGLWQIPCNHIWRSGGQLKVNRIRILNSDSDSKTPMRLVEGNKNRTAWTRWMALLAGLLPVSAMAAAGADAQAFKWSEFLGPFHNVVLHYPIGFVTMVLILECYGLRRDSAELRRIVGITWWLVIGSTILAAALGFARASDGGYGEATLQAHKVAGIAVIVLAAIALVISRYRMGHPERDNTGWRAAYGFMLLATFCAMVVAGHKGGDLTHGSDYLTRNAPPVIKELFEPEPDTNTLATSTENTAAVAAEPSFFARKVWPVLEKKCVRCHGPEKHKGDYRLDTREFALTPGESEENPIVPGKPEESFLVELISLPEDDDEVMPPSGKEPLTAEEKAAIIQWIKDGASYDMTASS